MQFLSKGVARRAAFALSALLSAGATQAEDFAQCLARLQQQARSEGLSPRVTDAIVPALRYVPRVIELDRKQPEFTDTFANYIGKRITDTNIATGRALITRYQSLLNALEQKYGVPGSVIVAFWGLETNYGSYMGKMSALDNLATLACDERRSAFFTGELMHALHLANDLNLDPAQMEGSWAGALGHTQFMPSAYRRYGIDGDGDGRVNLWGSIPDALTSAANFLQNLGWVRDQRWGREVRLPQGFAYELMGVKNARSVDAWKQLGITDASGQPLPANTLNTVLVVPAGYQGPKFLVSSNFEVILRWNRSEYYGLAVGYLSDRLNGMPPLRQAPPTDAPRLSMAKVTELQNKLVTLGFDLGTPDGVLGPATKQAIRNYQVQQKMVADGYPSLALLKSLGITP